MYSVWSFGGSGGCNRIRHLCLLQCLSCTKEKARADIIPRMSQLLQFFTTDIGALISWRRRMAGLMGAVCSGPGDAQIEHASIDLRPGCVVDRGYGLFCSTYFLFSVPTQDTLRRDTVKCLCCTSPYVSCPCPSAISGCIDEMPCDSRNESKVLVGFSVKQPIPDAPDDRLTAASLLAICLIG